MLSPAILASCVPCMGFAVPPALPPVSLATFGVGDTLLIVVVALIVFGPKKLPEISRQIGKLLYEFRKASNDFKFQIEEELRAAEQAERQKELSTEAGASQPATPIAISAGETVSAEPVVEDVPAMQPADAAAFETSSVEPGDTGGTPTIQPPASGVPVSTRSPYRAIENTEGATEVTAAGESLDEPRALDEPRVLDEPQAFDDLQANAQEAVRAAAADASYKEPGTYDQSGDAVPTHHG